MKKEKKRKKCTGKREKQQEKEVEAWRETIKEKLLVKKARTKIIKFMLQWHLHKV